MPRTPLTTACLAVLLGLLAPREAHADPTLPAVFSDHCVLQQGQPVAVWGRAEPGERIKVVVAGHSASAVTDGDGRWRVELPALEAGGPYALTVQGKTTLKLRDVLVGEVWVCSGQSNMAWPVKAARDAQAEIASARYPEIRLFSVPRRPALAAQDDVEAQWVACSPATVPGFSAVAYYFGRELHQALKVPIGLVHTSWGGTPAEAWTPDAALREKETLAPLLDQWEQRIADAKAKGAKDLTLHHNRPGNLYRGMIAPLVPLTMRGAIWYQGESNANRAWEYRTLFPVMIRAWRAAWQRPDLPFHFVQLANFHPRKPHPGDSAWAELRDAQLHTLRTVPHTGMAVTIDVGEAGDIHPKNKQDVGKRLARWALSARLRVGARALGPDLPRALDRRRRGDAAVRPRRQRACESRRRAARGVFDRGRGPRLSPGECSHRRRHRGRLVARGAVAASRALRVGRQSRLQPPERGGPSGLALPHRRLATHDPAVGPPVEPPGARAVGCSMAMRLPLLLLLLVAAGGVVLLATRCDLGWADANALTKTSEVFVEEPLVAHAAEPAAEASAPSLQGRGSERPAVPATTGVVVREDESACVTIVVR